MLMFALFAGFAVAVSIPKETLNRQELVDYINSQNVPWFAKIDRRFEGKPLHSSKHLYGVRMEESRAQTAKALSSGELRLAPVISEAEAASLPDTFDSATNWPECAKVIMDIRDQSNCGCCWAFAGASAASDRACIATNGTIAVPFSSQDICFNAEPDSAGGCDGGTLYTAWSYIHATGVVTGGQYLDDIAKVPSDPFHGEGFCSSFSLPHCHHHGPVGIDPYPAEGATGCPHVVLSPKGPTKCDNSSKIQDFEGDKYSFNGTVYIYPQDEASIRKAIWLNGPVEAAFTVYSDFEQYAGGIYTHTAGQEEGGHAIRIVGWGSENGVDYWKIANSWNPYWGEKGYFRIKRGTNECGIESQIFAADPAAKWGKKNELS